MSGQSRCAPAPATPAGERSVSHPAGRHAAAVPIAYAPAALSQPLPQEIGRPGVDIACANLVVVTAASGGIGASALAALLAHEFAARDLKCALADLDLDSGGLDLLLGIEREPGLRLGRINAPLGRIEGDALNHELPHWEGVAVLAHAPWISQAPDWWETQAALRALAEVNQVVVVDAGRGRGLDAMPDLLAGVEVVAIELSVLGLARAKAHLAMLRRMRDALAESLPGDLSRPLVVGLEPRGAPHGSSKVGVDEAGDYLGMQVLGPLRMRRAFCGRILDGLGVSDPGRANRRVVAQLADEVETRLFGVRDD